jgi:hypothetical protein
MNDKIAVAVQYLLVPARASSSRFHAHTASQHAASGAHPFFNLEEDSYRDVLSFPQPL